MKLGKKIINFINSFRKPLWFQWSLFPKEGNPPTHSVLEILIYILICFICYFLYYGFNEIPYSTYNLNIDKLSYVRSVNSVITEDTTYYFHYQVSEVDLTIPRTTMEINDTIDVYNTKIWEDSLEIKGINHISEETDTLIQTGLTPYWNAILDFYAPYGHEIVRLLKYNHDKHYDNSICESLKGMLSETEGHRFPFDRLKVRDPNKWMHRYYFGLSSNISKKEKEKVVKQWEDSMDEHDFSTQIHGIKKEGDRLLYYIDHYSATNTLHNYVENGSIRIWDSSPLVSYVSLQPPGWFNLYDISQGWFDIRLNTQTIDSVALTINFVGATEFFPMNPEPDEKGSNYIMFVDPYKIHQIRKKGLVFFAKFKELENRQNIRCFAVTAIFSGLLIVLITFFVLGLYRAPRIIRKTARYDDMQKWFAYQRRHNANVFDVFFKDKENISDENIMNVIKDVVKFFDLPLPVIQDKCESIAKIMTSENGNECEVYYDWKLMEKAGINNTDTLRLSFAHELSHQVLYNTRFLLFENELWVQELAADMLVGAFSAIGDDVATGKYKYVLRQLPASMTHPNGSLRAAIVEYGREYITRLREQQNKVSNIQEVLKGLPAFVYEHYQELHESWDDVQLEDEEEDCPVEPPPIDYESLPDTNLLKQYYMKYKKDKEDDI